MRRFMPGGIAALALTVLVLADASAQDRASRDASYRRWLAQGITRLKKVGNVRRAAESLREAVRIDPTRADAFVQLGRAHVVSGDVERAVFCYYEALRRTPPADTGALLAELRKHRADAAIVEKGSPTTLIARCYARSATDAGGRGDAGSLDVGGRLDERLLLVQARDARGRLIASFAPRREVSAGLKLREGVISGGPAPSRLEWIRLSTDGAEPRAAVQVRVIGPITRLALQAQRDALGPGEMLHISARGFDAAGNRLYHDRYEWTARRGEVDVDEMLSGTVSRGQPDFRGESQRVNVKAPAKVERAQLGEYTITARHAKSGVESKVTFELKAEAVGMKYTWPPFTWTDDLEDALGAARKQGKPLLLNFYAEW